MKISTKHLSVLILSMASLQASANTDHFSFNNTIKQMYQGSSILEKNLKKQSANHDASPVETVIDTASLMPNITVSNIVLVEAVVISIDLYNQETMDVTSLDDFIADIIPNARHYPPNFPTRTQKHNTRESLERYVKWIGQFADKEDASYEVLIRAAQLNGMARNLDMGSDYAVRASDYVGRAVSIMPEDMEANLLYGIMLSEGGAFKTSLKYLNKAVEVGSMEAEQTIAQSDLMNDKREQSLQRLQALQQRIQEDNQNSNLSKQVAQQIAIVEKGSYRIWDLPAPDVNVKSLN